MKKIFLVLVFSFIIFGTGCTTRTNVEESDYESSTISVSEMEEESSAEESASESSMPSIDIPEETSKDEGSVITTGNPYFFFEGNSVVYNIEEVDFEEVPDTMDLQIDLIQEFEKGFVYHLHFEGCELSDPRLRDRTDLGYFYITPEEIYYRVQPEDIEKGEGSIVENALLMAQLEDREDLLGKGEVGWHDSIVVDGNRVIYDGYAFVTETATSFYESYVWEEGKGLVEYVSGYGAGAHEVIYTQAK